MNEIKIFEDDQIRTVWLKKNSNGIFPLLMYAMF